MKAHQKGHDTAILRTAQCGWEWGSLGVTVDGKSIITVHHPEHGKVVGTGRSDGYAMSDALEKIADRAG